MTPEQRELFRISLLRVLDANRSQFGFGLTALATLVLRFGFKVGPDDVEPEIIYLEDKGFVTLIGKAISPENRTWRITADGRDYLASNG